MIRAFVAIDIPTPIKEELLGEYKDIKSHFQRQGASSLKWVAPTNWHITLKFLGELPEAVLPRCQEILRACGGAYAPFKMRFKNVGCFPSPKRPRVVWAGVEEEEKKTLSGLSACLDQAFEGLGVAREERAFHAHLTFCRIKRPTPLHGPLIIDLIKRQFSTTWFEVREISLFKSTLTPKGPIYSLIFKAPLADR